MPAGIETFGNQPSATVSSGGTTTSDTSFTVSGSVSWPSASSSVTPNTFFRITDQANTSEIMIVTSAAGGVPSSQSWTVQRGAEGSTAIAHASGWTAVQVITAGTLQNVKQASNAVTSAVTVSATTTETVIASYTPVAADIEAGATFEIVAFGPLLTQGGTARGTLAFNVYWGGSGAPGSAFTSTGSVLLASLKTGSNAPAFASTTMAAGSSFDVEGIVTLLSTTTATANLNAWYSNATTLATTSSNAQTTNTSASGGSASSTAKTISGSGPIILTAVWTANFTTYTLTATAPLIYRSA